MTTKTPPSKVPFIDNPHAPEVFANEAAGFFAHAGNIHITFEAARCNHEITPGPVSRVVMGRLIMPASGAVHLAIGLYDFLTKQGLDLGPKPGTDTLQ